MPLAQWLAHIAADAERVPFGVRQRGERDKDGGYAAGSTGSGTWTGAREELAALMPLLGLACFDHRACNHVLRGLAVDMQTVAEESRR